jgi:tetratricopeptide (TPR) repeat protein
VADHADQKQRARELFTCLDPEYDERAGLTGCRIQRSGETLQRLVQLLAASPMNRPELARSEGFRDLSLADLLLERAAAAQPHDLTTSEELARLAFLIAEPIVADRWAGRANDVKARACVLAGNVRRLNRESVGAEEMFRKAVFYLTGPPDCRERAFYCRNLALLREDQGQLDEAVSLLWRAALIYRENAEPREEGCCLAQLGFLFLEEERIERAIPPLTQACQALQLPDDAVLYVRCALALAYCHAALAEGEKSQRFLQSARILYSHLPAGEPKAHVAWFEGKLAALAPTLPVHHFANQLSGANQGPDVSKGDAVWN